MSQPDSTLDRLQALPPLPHDADGPVFAEPWQAQAFALAYVHIKTVQAQTTLDALRKPYEDKLSGKNGLDAQLEAINKQKGDNERVVLLRASARGAGASRTPRGRRMTRQARSLRE